mgnify:CR=1 FL=1
MKINKFNSDGKNLIQIMSQLMHYLRNLVVNYYRLVTNKNGYFFGDKFIIYKGWHYGNYSAK